MSEEARSSSIPGFAPPNPVSPGVQRIEAISSTFTRTDRFFFFFFIFILAYVYGLDGTLRYTYQVRLHIHPLPFEWSESFLTF